MASFFKKNKDDKKKIGENIIGKIIYMFLLFAPLLSILTRCMYVTFNKNAYQSYSQKTEDALIKITNTAELYEDLNYNIVYANNSAAGTYSPKYGYKEISITPDNTWTNYNPQIEYAMIMTSSGNYVYLYDANGSNGTYKNIWGNSVKNIQITYSGHINDGYNITKGNHILTYQTIDKGTLDNVFSYSINKVEEDNLFNWSKTTGMYQVMQTTTSQLGITNTFTPMLLTYWLVISVMYFIYDIALMLVWILHRKIHELTESV